MPGSTVVLMLEKTGKWLFFSALLCLTPFAICRAGTINLDSSISFLQEKGERYSFEDLVSGPIDQTFEKAKNSRLYFGITQQPYWIKIEPAVKQMNESQTWVLELDTFKLNQIDLYYRNNSGKWQHQTNGIKLLDGTAKRPSRNNVFYLDSIDFEGSLFIRIEAHYVQMPVHIWSFEDYVGKEQNQILTDGLFYGIVLAIIAYHILIFLAVRNRSYLAYALFLIAVMMIYLSGQGWLHAYLFSTRSFPFSELTHFTGPFSGWLLLLTGVHFTKDYLNLSQWAKRLDKILIGFQLLTILIGVLAVFSLVFAQVFLFGILYNLGFVLAVMIIVVCFYAVIQGIRNQQATAKYYLLATSLQFLVSIFMILSAYHLIPSRFDWKALQFSSMLEMLIFSIGLSRQVKQIELDKQRYNQELLTVRGKMIEQLETINELKDKVLSKVIESRLYPELAKLFSVMNDVLYLQAIGNYSKVVFLNDGMEDEIEIQASLKDIETCFDNTIFLRIHKTYLIKIGLKLSLQRRSSADYDLISRYSVLPVGRKYYAEVKKQIGELQS